jgi:hypothetical protein
MTTPLNPEKIAQLLDAGTEQLDQTTLSALAEARHRALAVRPERASVLALSTGHEAHWLLPHTAKQWWATALLAGLLAVAGMTYWQNNHGVEEQTSDLDVAILSDEMPLDVFVD